jgi:hypothetical protein
LRNGTLHLAIQTAAGQACALEFTDSLSAPDWKPKNAWTGDGAVKVFAEPIGENRQRFYRVRVANGAGNE